MLDNNKNRYSLWLAWGLAFFMLLFHFYLKKYQYNNWSNQLSWDVTSYYLYLPLTFIYHDIGINDFSVLQGLFDKYQFSGTIYQVYKLDNGNWVMNYTCGFAYAYAPFFFIAHAWALLGGYAADGFSFPYQFCISNGVMLYIIAGVFILRKVLLHFLSDKVTFVTMFFMVLATNYFHETINDELQPHAMLFTLYALVLWLTIRWHERPSRKTAIALAAAMAWGILSRPSEILMLIIPVLWNVYDKASLRAKWQLIRRNWTHLIWMFVTAVIVVLPQMIYWKLNTGKFVFFSYQHTEGFDFLQPYFAKVLFSFKKSWFVYTPFIIFPIIAVFLLRRYYRPAYLAILIFFLANFYLLSSWAAWWNGGSFGMRYFVQSYAVMALPFGFMMKHLLETKWLKRFLITVFCLLMFLNLFQTWQYVKWIIPPDRMTKEYYKAIFLKTKVTEEDRWKMEVERSYGSSEALWNRDEYNKKVIGSFDFDTMNAVTIDPKYLDTVRFRSAPSSFWMNKHNVYMPAFRMPLNAITSKDHAWIRVSFSYYPVVPMKENPAALVIDMEHAKRFEYKYRAFNLENIPCKLNEWNHVSFEYMTPFPYREDDELKVYLWMIGEKDLFFDDLVIEAFEKK